MTTTARDVQYNVNDASDDDGGGEGGEFGDDGVGHRQPTVQLSSSSSSAAHHRVIRCCGCTCSSLVQPSPPSIASAVSHRHHSQSQHGIARCDRHVCGTTATPRWSCTWTWRAIIVVAGITALLTCFMFVTHTGYMMTVRPLMCHTRTPPPNVGLSPRLIMSPVLRAGFTNQIICFAELVRLAHALDARVCWPRLNLDGTSATFKQGYEIEWDTLLDRAYTRRRLPQVYGVEMVTNAVDQQLCDYAYDHLWLGLPHEQLCSDTSDHGVPSTIAGLTCREVIAAITPMAELPYDLARYTAAYDYGTRLLYFERVFQQWWERVHAARDFPVLPIFADDVIRPSTRLQLYINRILHYYDTQIVNATRARTRAHRAAAVANTDNNDNDNNNDNSNGISVIGIHLRVEGDYAGACGSLPSIVQRLCGDLRIGCNTSICIVATGSPRSEYAHVLPCGTILTKHEAWPPPPSMITTDAVGHAVATDGAGIAYPPLTREEWAVVELWTVTRAHIFAGCVISTLSMAGYAMHDAQLHAWRHHTDDEIAAIARAVPRKDTGDVSYGGITIAECSTCTPGTTQWITNHAASIAPSVSCATYPQS